MAPVEWIQDRLTDEEMGRLYADLVEAETELELELRGGPVVSAPVAQNEELHAIYVGLIEALTMLGTEMERRGLPPVEQNDLTNSEIDEILEHDAYMEHMEQMQQAAREQELLTEFEAQRAAEQAEILNDFAEEEWQEREARRRVDEKEIIESEDNRNS